LVGAVAVHLPRADWPAPDVNLALTAAAQVDPTVARVQHFHLLHLPILVHGVVAIGQDDRPLHLRRLGAPAPVADQLEVAVLLLTPQVGALAVVVEDPVARLPVALVRGLGLPVAEVQPGVKTLEPPGEVGRLLRRGVAAGQFLDFQVLEAALRALHLQGEVALARVALADAGDLLAIDRELDGAVPGDDAVVVPLVGAFGAALAGQAAVPAVRVRPVRLAAGPPDAEEVAVAGVVPLL